MANEEFTLGEPVGNWKEAQAQQAGTAEPEVMELGAPVGEWKPNRAQAQEEKPAYQAPEIQKQIVQSGDIEQAMRVSQGDLEWSLKLAHGVDPDTAARVKKIADAMKLPEDTVQRNLGTAEEMARAKEVLKHITTKDDKGTFQYPYTLSWLGDPERMKVAKDDVAAMTEIEQAIRRSKAEDDGFLARSGSAVMMGVANLGSNIAKLPAGAYDLAAYPQNKIAQVFDIPELKVRAPEWLRNNYFARFYDNAAEYYKPVQMDQSIVVQAKEGKIADAAQNLYLQVISQAPQLALLGLSGGAAAAAGATAAGAEATSLVSMGALEYADAAANAAARGKDPAAATEGAALRGVAEGYFEKYTFGIVKNFGTQLSKSVGKQTAKEIVKEMAKHGLKDAYGEGMSEAQTSFAQDLADFATGDKEALDGSLVRAADAFLVGATMGGSMAAAGVAVSARSKSAEYQRQAKEWAQAEAQAAASKLRERDPGAFHDFVSNVVAGSGASPNVFVPAEAVQAYAQTRDPKQLEMELKEIGIAEQVKEAEKTGQEIEIPKATWLSKIVGTDLHKALAEEVRFSQDGLNAREQGALNESVQKQMAEMQTEFQRLQEEEKLPEQVVAIRDKMLASKEEGGAGMRAEDADAQLAVLMAGAKVLSKKSGETVNEWFARVNPVLNVGGEGKGDLFQEKKPAPAFYSRLEQLAEEKLPKSATPAQILATLKDVKAEELQYSGLQDFLKGKEKVSKEELLSFLQENQIQFKEVVKGGPEDQFTVYEEGEKRGTFGTKEEAQDFIDRSVESTLDELRATSDSWVEEDLPIYRAQEESRFHFASSAEEAGATKFGQYTLPGGENYREVLLTLPAKSKESFQGYMLRKYGDKFLDMTDDQVKFYAKKYENEQALEANANAYRSSHFEEPNILGHIRLKDRIDADGKRVLFVEEIQSDWHQAGRKKGYKTGKPTGLKVSQVKENGRFFEIVDENGQFVTNVLDDGSFKKLPVNEENAVKIAQQRVDSGSIGIGFQSDAVPDAPFKKNWHELLLKRVLREAVEKGYDRVAWTTGEQQAERYDLSKSIDRVEYKKHSNPAYKTLFGKYDILPYDKNGKSKSGLIPAVEESKLEEILGKELAAKVIKGEGAQGEGDAKNYKVLSGLDLKVGGEGMKGFYDKMIPDFLSKYTKKWGGKVSATEITLGHSFGVNQKAVYEGPSYTAEKLRELSTDPDLRAHEKQTLREVADRMVEGMDFQSAIQRYGNMAVAEHLGGKLDFVQDKAAAKVHALDITSAMREAILFEGQPLFQNDDVKRGSIFFDRGRAIISLFETANFSTFLHETGHLFAREMQLLVESGKADEQTKKDFETLVEFAGGKLDRAGHEKIAESFEVYLREGKAPSVKLAAAFQKFRAWLMAIYRTIRGKAKVSEEVSGVFDRLLASESEIEEARRYYGAKRDLLKLIPEPEPKQLELAKVLDQKSRADALDAQVRKYMKAYLAAIGGKQAFTEFATREVEATPVYAALEAAIEKGGLDPKALKEVYGEATLKAIEEKHGKAVKAKGTVTLGELAIELGYASEDALLTEMKAAAPKAEAIKARAKELLTEREADIRAELSKQERTPGEEAYHTESRLAYLVAEAQMIQAKLEQAQARAERKLEAKVYEDTAREAIAKKPVKLAGRYDLFAKAEQKFANQAFDAAQKGDLVAAHEAKKKQILNHALVRAAIEARDERVAIEKKFKPKAFAAKLKGVENAFAEIAADLALTYGLTEGQAPKASPKDLAAVLSALDENLVAQIPTWILAREKAGSFKELTMQELRELDAAIGSILHLGRDELKSLQETQWKTVSSFVEASKTHMAELPDAAIHNEFSAKGKFLSKVNGLLSHLVMFDFLFERLDNYKFTRSGEFGPLRKLFNEGVNREAQYTDLRTETFQLAEPHWKTLAQAARRLEARFGGKSFDIPGVPMIPGMKKLGREQWTAERVISFVLNMGNEGNMTALTNAYQYSPAQMQAIAGLLTKEELHAIQGIWNATDHLFPQLDRTHFAIYNRHLEKVVPQELKVKAADGEVTLKGGYYPLQFDHKLSDQAGKYFEEDVMKNRTTAVFRSTKPEDGMTFSRTPGHSLPPKLELSVWSGHIADTARYISHAEYLRDLNRITRDKEWKSLFQDKTGRASKGTDVYSQLRGWVQYQAHPEHISDNGWAEFFANQRSRASVVTLGFSPRTALKQLQAHFETAQEIGWRWMLSGLVEQDFKSFAGLESGAAFEKIFATSPYLRARENSIDREIREATQKFDPMVKRLEIAGHEFTADDIRNFAFTFIGMVDRHTVSIGWRGAFNKYMHEHRLEGTEEERFKKAVEYADVVIRTTQQSSLPIEQNALQRSNDGTLRTFAMFMTWQFKWNGRIAHYFRGYKAGAISLTDLARHVAYEHILGPWSTLAITALLAGELPEWWEMLVAPGENAIGGLPIIRDIPGAGRFGRNVGQTPVFEGLNRIGKAGKTTFEWMNGKKEYYQALWDIGRVVEFQTGIPALKVAKSMDDTYKLIKGEKKRGHK